MSIKFAVNSDAFTASEIGGFGSVAYPISQFVWIKFGSVINAKYFGAIGHASSSKHEIKRDYNSKIVFQTKTSAGNAIASTGDGILSQDVWYAVLFERVSADLGRLSIATKNGTPLVIENTDSLGTYTPGSNFVSLCASNDVALIGNVSNAVDIYAAEQTIWNRALTAEEFKSLSEGIHPETITDGLKGHWFTNQGTDLDLTLADSRGFNDMEVYDVATATVDTGQVVNPPVGSTDHPVLGDSVVNPILTVPVATVTDTTVSLGVTTDTSSGTAYCLVQSEQDTPPVNADAIIANGNTEAVVITDNAIVFTPIAGLALSTTYVAYYTQELITGQQADMLNKEFDTVVNDAKISVKLYNVVDGEAFSNKDNIHYVLYEGTNVDDFIPVYKGKVETSDADGLFEVFTPNHVAGDRLMLNLYYPAADDIFSDDTEVGGGPLTVISGEGGGIPVIEVCLVTSGTAGLAEYANFDNGVTLGANWKIKFTFDFETNTANSQSHIATGAALIFSLLPEHNRLQAYDGNWYNFNFGTDISSGSGEHTIEIFQDGPNVVAILDSIETKSELGTFTISAFTRLFTNTPLEAMFVGAFKQISFYDDNVEVRNYTFNSGSTVQEVDSISGEILTYVNVTDASWVPCEAIEVPPVNPPTGDTFLEWENDLTPRTTIDQGIVVDLLQSKGYPKTALAGGPDMVAMTINDMKRYDMILAHAFANELAMVATMQDPNGIDWRNTRYVRQVNIEFLDWDWDASEGIKQARQPAFIDTGPVSGVGDGITFAGHWLYKAYTTITEQLSANGTSIKVADGSKIQSGQYVCIHDGSFGNAEHCLVIAKNGNEISLSSRGYRSSALVHNSGSRIAVHTMGARPDNNKNFCYNMATTCPVDGAGKKCNEWFAEWMLVNAETDQNGNTVNNLRTDGKAVDIDFKNQIQQASYNNSTTNNAGADVNSNWLWGGLDDFFGYCRSNDPTRAVSGGLNRSPGYGSFHGVQEEGWPMQGINEHTVVDRNDLYSYYKRFDWVMSNYILRQREHLAPQSDWHCLFKNPSAIYSDNVPGNQTKLTDNNNMSLRFALATALMGAASFAQQAGGESYSKRSSDPWYDEYSVNTSGVAIRAGEWYNNPDRYPGSPGNPDPWQEAIDGKHWLGQPVSNFKRVFNDSDFDADDVIYDQLKNEGVNLTGWVGTNTSLTVDNSMMKCSKHTSYQATLSNVKAAGPSITTKSGNRYTLTFKAYTTRFREIQVTVAGVDHKIDISDEKRNYSLTFKASANSSNIFFAMGLDNTEIWFGDVKVFGDNVGTTDREINAFSREFDNGLVLANGNYSPMTFALPVGVYKRILGVQDPTVNNGADIDNSITIQPFDGILLFKK